MGDKDANPENTADQQDVDPEIGVEAEEPVKGSDGFPGSLGDTAEQEYARDLERTLENLEVPDEDLGPTAPDHGGDEVSSIAELEAQWKVAREQVLRDIADSGPGIPSEPPGEDESDSNLMPEARRRAEHETGEVEVEAEARGEVGEYAPRADDRLDPLDSPIYGDPTKWDRIARPNVLSEPRNLPGDEAQPRNRSDQGNREFEATPSGGASSGFSFGGVDISRHGPGIDTEFQGGQTAQDDESPLPGVDDDIRREVVRMRYKIGGWLQKFGFLPWMLIGVIAVGGLGTWIFLAGGDDTLIDGAADPTIQSERGIDDGTGMQGEDPAAPVDDDVDSDAAPTSGANVQFSLADIFSNGSANYVGAPGATGQTDFTGNVDLFVRPLDQADDNAFPLVSLAGDVARAIGIDESSIGDGFVTYGLGQTGGNFQINYGRWWDLDDGVFQILVFGGEDTYTDFTIADIDFGDCTSDCSDATLRGFNGGTSSRADQAFDEALGFMQAAIDRSRGGRISASAIGDVEFSLNLNWTYEIDGKLSNAGQVQVEEGPKVINTVQFGFGWGDHRVIKVTTDGLITVDHSEIYSRSLTLFIEGDNDLLVTASYDQLEGGPFYSASCVQGDCAGLDFSSFDVAVGENYVCYDLSFLDGLSGQLSVSANVFTTRDSDDPATVSSHGEDVPFAADLSIDCPQF